MKRTKLIAIIICALYISVIFPSVFVYAAADSEAYKDGYSNGLWEGSDAAYDDLEDNYKKNFRKAMPKDDEIIARYDLDIESKSYRTDFIRGYKQGFEAGYNNTYDNPKIEVAKTNYDEMLGYEMGMAAGYNDYYAGKKNKWADAAPSITKLIDFFQLKNETTAYKNEFNKNFKEKFKEGYELGYKNAKFEPLLLDVERGAKDGETLGGLLGSNYGSKDYYDGKPIDWERDLMSDSEIKSTFSLGNEVLDYQKSFLGAFKFAYRERYSESYRNAMVGHQNLLFKNGNQIGYNLGIDKGTSMAKTDFIMGKPNNGERYSLNDENIAVEHNLHNENKRYRDGFIGGYKEGFKKGYLEAYQQYSYASLSEKIGEEIIPIRGGQVLANDSKLRIVFENGTFYNDVLLTMDKHLQVKNSIGLPLYDQYTKNSDLYQLKVNNPYGKYDNDKMIKLSLEYYGGMNGGIYRYLYGNWEYLPSTITENTITAYLSPKTIQENAVYGVFIDTKAITPLDIRGHWAKDEVITTLRRGHTGLYNDNSFRPDVSLTKVQLLLYLGRANKWWKLNLKDEDRKLAESLNDFKEIEDVKELVAYSIKEGFLGVSKDNKFNPNSTISYGELEKIIKKVYPDSNFTWKWVSDKMATIKDKRCSSVDSMNNKVTRAEFAYMLNLLNQ